MNDEVVGMTALRIAAGEMNHDAAVAVVDAARNAANATPVATVGPTGVSGAEPLALVTHEGKTAYYSECDAETAKELVRALEDDELPTDEADTVVTHDATMATLPTPAGGPFGVGDRQTFAACGWVRPTNVADYTATREFLTTNVTEPESLLVDITESGVRGRGRGDGATDETVADRWRTAAAADGDPVVVVNANEADPDAVADRLLLEADPIAVLDAALAAAVAVDATDVVVYVNETDSLAADRVETAAEALHDAAVADVPIEVVAGPDEYKAGEMTMALEALEGNDRLEARRRPPGPESHGLYGRPTVVHTPRTLAQVRLALGNDEEAAPGTETDPGTRLLTIAGDVESPVTVELATDRELSVVVDAVDVDGDLKAACVGGVFGGITQTLDVRADADSLADANLGRNGVVQLLSDRRCAVALAGERASFARDENCGRCVPCREGSAQLVELLRDVYDGTYAGERIEELSRVMRRSSICAFGQAAARPVTTAMTAFESEFTAHANGNCPTGACVEQEIQ